MLQNENKIHRGGLLSYSQFVKHFSTVDVTNNKVFVGLFAEVKYTCRCLWRVADGKSRSSLQPLCLKLPPLDRIYRLVRMFEFLISTLLIMMTTEGFPISKS